MLAFLLEDQYVNTEGVEWFAPCYRPYCVEGFDSEMLN